MNSNKILKALKKAHEVFPIWNKGVGTHCFTVDEKTGKLCLCLRILMDNGEYGFQSVYFDLNEKITKELLVSISKQLKDRDNETRG